jgi:hypothetical protein
MTASTASSSCPSPSNQPRLAAFPKAFMQQLCKTGTMTLAEWIELAAPLELDGLSGTPVSLKWLTAANGQRFAAR